MSRLERNAPLVCVFHALQMALFPMAIVTLFFQDHLALGMTEIMLLQAIFGLTTAVFEFPSGLLADRIGYRPTLVLSALSALVGWSAFAVAFDFWTAVIAEVLLAASLALSSGTDRALLYESLVETDCEHHFARWYGRFRFFGQFAEGSAALLAGIAFAYWARLPFVLQAGFWAVNLGVALCLVETARRAPREGSGWQQVRKLVRYAAIDRPRLRAVIALTTAAGIASFIPVWIVALYARDAGVPVAWLGPIWAAANYFVAVGAISSERTTRALGFMPVLVGCVALCAAGYLGMGLTTAWWGFAFYFLFNISRGVLGTTLHHEEQRLIPSDDRAGLLSLNSLIFRLAFVPIGPAVGFAIDQTGQHAVLLGTGAVICTLAWLSCYWLARTPDRSASPPG